jgi:hypothetical protein
MAQAQSRPAWVGTDDRTATALERWARDRGLTYEPSAVVLPPVSDRLMRSFGHPGAWAKVIGGKGGKGFGSEYERPGRFSENLCSGILPGGFEGTLGHHAYVEDRGDADDERWHAMGFTAVVIDALESLRVTRWLVGDAPRKDPKLDVDLVGETPYGPMIQEADLTPSLADRFAWRMPIRERREDVVRAFSPALVDALAAAPEGTRITVQSGWIVAELWQYRWEASELDGLCRTACAVAGAMLKAAAALPDLEPGAALAAPESNQIQRWMDQMVAQVDWPEPPASVAAAVEAYAEHARQSPHARQRRFLAGRAAFIAVFVFFVVPWAVIGYVVEGVLAAVGAGALALAIAVTLTLVVGGRAHKRVSEEHAHGWGLEAFGREYARSRGLWPEDVQEFRKRFAPPLHGGPQFVMRGRLPGDVDGRIVLWRDGADPERLERLYNLVLVPDATGWSITSEPTDDAARTVEALDALARKAAGQAG